MIAIVVVIIIILVVILVSRDDRGLDQDDHR